MDQKEYGDFLVSLGSTKKTISNRSHWGRNYEEVQYSTPKVPEDRQIYLKFTGGVAPRIGAIGRLKEFQSHNGNYYSHPSLVIEFDERPGKEIVISYYDVEPMPEDYPGGTQWLWVTRKHNKVEIPVPVNRFGQELHEGTLVVCNRYGRHGNIMFGIVTRYTASNVWVKPIKITPSCPSSKELRADTISETFVLPEDFEHTYLFAVKLMSY